MILLLKALCDGDVITGFPNEIQFIQLEKFHPLDKYDSYKNEYITYNYTQKESSIISIKLREVNQNYLQFLEIWLLSSNKNYFQITKIIPSFNKTELIHQFNSIELNCLEICFYNDNIIVHCKKLISNQLTLVRFNKIKKNIQQQVLEIFIEENVNLFFDYFFIIQYQNKIVFYDIESYKEIKTLRKENFNLNELNIKKLIVQNATMIILTHDFLCQIVYLYDQFKIQKVEYHSQIIDIFMNQQYGLLLVSNQTIELMAHQGFFFNKVQTFFQQQQFEYQIINRSQVAYKQQFQNQEYMKLNSCLLESIKEFVYNLQIILCLEQNKFHLVQITHDIFQKIIISNSVYQNYLMRTLNSGEIRIFDFDRDFFPILYLEQDTTTFKMEQNIFHGPNITLEFKSKEINILYQSYNEFNSLNSCIYYEIYYDRDVQNYNHICQVENKTIIFKTSASQTILYQINFFLQDFKILKCISENLYFINDRKQQFLILTPQKTIQYNIQNYKMVSVSQYMFILFKEKIIYFNQHYVDEVFEIILTDFQTLQIYQEIQFIYISNDDKYLFICTQNFIIILSIQPTSQGLLLFYVTQVIQTQDMIKQIYFSNKILYLIFQENLMQIKKYYQISKYYFELIGNVDCLGQTFNTIITNNRAVDYFYISQNSSLLIFKLSNSLQNSFIGIIPEAEYVQSSDKELIIRKNSKLLVYVFHQFTIYLQSDILHSQIIPVQICASNSYSKQCITQNIKLVKNNFPLKIQDYQLRHIEKNKYIINFNIIQGYINDISLNNLRLNQFKLLYQNHISVQEILTIGDYFVFFQAPKVVYFKFNGSRSESVTLDQFNCQRVIFINHYFFCQEMDNTLKIYNCKQFPNCLLIDNENINFRPIVQIKNSGFFLFLTLQYGIQIVQFDLNHQQQFIIVYRSSQKPLKSLIQDIDGQNLWLINIHKLDIELLVLEGQKVLHKWVVDIQKLFNSTQQFFDDSDKITNIKIISFTDLDISILFLMKNSAHKVYRFTNIHDHLDIQCLYLLLNSQKYNSIQHPKFSQIDDLLFIVIDYNIVGVYNLSTANNLYVRDFILILKLKEPAVDQMIRIIHLHKYQDKILLFVVLFKNIFYYVIQLDYELELQSGLNIININKHKENLQLKVYHIGDNNNNDMMENIAVIALISSYFFIRLFKLTHKID